MLVALPLVILSVVLSAQAKAHIARDAVARHHPRVSVPREPLAAPVKKKRSSCNPPLKTTTTSTKKTTTTTKTTAKTTKTTAASSKATTAADVVQAGTIKVVDNACGPSGATTKTTATTGPNGDIGWLNCGVTGSGWNPPNVQVSDLVLMDLNDALKASGTPFSACSAYTGYFYQYAAEYGLEPIMLAATAMQESSCDASTVGGGGEQGLMQITQDKCGGAPGGNCKDPAFNIKTGAAYMKSVLDSNNGNILETIGNYNGWEKGMTKGYRRRKITLLHLPEQSRLYFNGWLQNINAYEAHLGQYFNLDVCPDK
ncbi:Lysozyme-like protein [Mycena sanguinolenta]|uniref:Lysozyme-like protein n=1 Tax=Mycena sanguinolenta TaxID=230812 RepID=A0A8H6ZCA4_9AGAR|nr:Lysozyme-like protein [Mycena sanguinolenta]